MRLFVGMMLDSGDIETENDDACSCGISLRTDTPIIVELSGALRQYVSEYFQLEEIDNNNLRAKLKSRDTWYRIIDGQHSHSAIVKLISKYDRWKGFKWFCTDVLAGYSFEV